jgi:hypothetical protein
MRTIDLFRRQGEANLFCALLKSLPVPKFLIEDEWEYARPVDVGTLSGFDAAVARVSAGANGFYLFHSAA